MPKGFLSILYFGLVFSLIFGLPLSSFADETVTISATVGSDTPPPGGGGGGGGGGSGGYTIPTTVNFSGMAYPLSKVYILKDGQIVATTIADPGANFSVSLSDLATKIYTFSVYVEDSNMRKSSAFSFPIYVTSGTTVNIGNIFLSPTIDIDKSVVRKGDNLAIFGQSIPKSEVTISVHSDPEYFFKVTSNTSGTYLYNLDTSSLEIGSHQTKSKTTLNGQLSSFGTPLSFLVGGENKIKDEVLCEKKRSDLNCDGRVNLIDFSIMAYWYKRPNPPSKVDLNGDQKISLVDFSIIAYDWTG
jgi:hypothetical protein